MYSVGKQLPCDQCHERRVRCRGSAGQSCNQCTKTNLHCTRLLVRRKRGPKPAGRPKSSKSRNGDVNGQTLGEHSSPASGSISAIAKDDDTAGTSLTDPYELRPVNFQSDQTRAASMTVNDLANSILEHESTNTPQGEMAWLSSLRSAEGFGDGSALQYSPSLVKPGIWMSDLERLQQHIDGPHSPDQHTTTFSDLDSSLSATQYKLDGTALAVTVGLPIRYGLDLIQCVETYFTSLHHVLPVIHEASFRLLLTCPPQLTSFQRSLFLAVCAVAKLKGDYAAEGIQYQTSKEMGCIFLERCLQFRASIDYMDEQSLTMVIVSYLLHIAYACLNQARSARFYLQEAICQALDQGLHFENGLVNHTDPEKVCAQRTLALLFVTERATVVLNDCAAVLLREPPYLPQTCFNEADGITLQSFRCLFSLFALLDIDIVEYWCSRKLRHQEQRQTLREKLELAQNSLLDIAFDEVALDDFHRADILVTQQWLRFVCWQTSMRLGFLSSQSTILAFSYDYPIEISISLCGVLESLPPDSLKVHHFSIYCKIFEVAYSLMDILMLAGRKPGSRGVYELKTLFRYLSTSPINNMRFARILLEKDTGHDASNDQI